MALDNAIVLSELRQRLDDNERARYKILGAIEVLEQIEASKVVPAPEQSAAINPPPQWPPTKSEDQGEEESPEVEEK